MSVEEDKKLRDKAMEAIRIAKELHEEATGEVFNDVVNERTRQLELWGIQRHPYQEWRAILDEETAEFACKVIAAKENGYEELVQVVAVGIAWLIDIWLKKESLAYSDKEMKEMNLEQN